MGASTSGLSGSAVKGGAEEGEIKIKDGMPLHPGNRDRSDTVVRDTIAKRIHSAHSTMKLEDVQRLAISLSKSKNLQETYFSQILEDSKCNSSLCVTIIWKDISNSLRTEIADTFSRFASQFKYGPYCATVKVGSLYMMWDNNSIVIPQTKISTVFKALPATNVHHKHEAVDIATMCPLTPDDVEISTVFREEILIEMGPYVSERINALMDMLIRYNTKFHYGLLTCNCQHFVTDILEALEARQLAPAFEDYLSHHANVLECRGLNVLQEEFNSHAELDNYVNIQLENMDAGERCFCYGHYLLFHAWYNECPHLKAFECSIATCRMRELKGRV